MNSIQAISRAETYRRQLEDEGYQSRWGETNHLEFKRAGLTYLLRLDERDPQFLEFVLPDLWAVTDAFERANVLRAINEVNAAIKVVKLVLVESRVWANFETFIADPADFRDALRRGFCSIDLALECFTIRLREDLRSALP